MTQDHINEAFENWFKEENKIQEWIKICDRNHETRFFKEDIEKAFTVGFKAALALSEKMQAEKCSCKHLFASVKDGYPCCSICGIYFVKISGYAILTHDINAAYKTIFDAIEKGK